MYFLPGSVLITLLLTLTIFIVFYFKWRFTYWQRKNVPGPKPSIPFGNVLTSLPPMHEYLKIMYDQMRQLGHKHIGIYIGPTPVYVVMEPEYIKAILTKDFAHFTDRGIYYNKRDDPVGSHILVLKEQEWRRLRTKFTPMFTIGKTKMMFGNVQDCAEQMLEVIDRGNVNSVDIKEICACYTTDVVGSCAFGINCNSLTGKGTEFRKYSRRFFDMSRLRVLRIILCSVFQNIAKFFKLTIMEQQTASFFTRVIESTLRYREEKGARRNDFLQLLIDLRKEDQNGLTVNEITAQSFLFFAAGYETSSNTTTFCIFELAYNTTIQDKVRSEIEDVLAENDGKLTYESILEMKYLSQVVDETLRKYPSAPSIPRVCTADYKLPNGEHYIEKGTHVFIPVYALHRDPEYYPDPEKFDPDRFTEENKAKRHSFAYLPFGEGPRICIGQRFGLLQVKVGLITLLRNYRFSLNSRTKYPLKFHKSAIFLSARESVWVDIERI